MVVADTTAARFAAAARKRPAVSAVVQPDSRRTLADCLYLAGLSGIVGSVVGCYGGASRPQFEAILAVLGVFSVAFWCFRRDRIRAPSLPWIWVLPFAGFLLLVAFQLVPLPNELLEVISPARAALATAAAPVLGESRFAPLSAEPGTTFAHLMRVVSYLLVFLLVRELGWSLRARRWLLALPLVAIAVGEACLAIFQWTAGAGQIQAAGSFINPNHLAGLLGLTAPLAVAMVFAAWQSGKRARRRRWWDLAAAGAAGAAAIIAVGVTVSVSRMGLASAIAGVCSTLAIVLKTGPLQTRRRFIAKGATVLAAAAIVAAVVFLAPDKLISRIAYLTDGPGITAQSRLPLWRDSVQLIREYPLFGCGLGAFAAPFLKHKRSELMLFDQYAHNDYLQVLAETGFAGFALLLGLLLVALYSCWPRRTQSQAGRALMAGAFGAFLAISLHSLTDFNLYIPANAMIVAWIGGIAASAEHSHSQGAEVHATPAVSPLTLSLALRWAWRR